MHELRNGAVRVHCVLAGVINLMISFNYVIDAANFMVTFGGGSGAGGDGGAIIIDHAIAVKFDACNFADSRIPNVSISVMFSLRSIAFSVHSHFVLRLHVHCAIYIVGDRLLTNDMLLLWPACIKPCN